MMVLEANPFPSEGDGGITFSLKGGDAYALSPHRSWPPTLPIRGWWWLCPLPLEGGAGFPVHPWSVVMKFNTICDLIHGNV